MTEKGLLQRISFVTKPSPQLMYAYDSECQSHLTMLGAKEGVWTRMGEGSYSKMSDDYSQQLLPIDTKKIFLSHVNHYPHNHPHQIIKTFTTWVSNKRKLLD